MEQLIMSWNNNGKPAPSPIAPEGFHVITFPELPDALDKWLDIVRYGLSAKLEDASYYDKIMTKWANYNDKNCFFVMHGDEAVATITVICNYEIKDGYIHMVAVKPEFRGCGLGNFLNLIAEKVLKDEGMKTAHLTTDDFRIPAIKSYLKAGFIPDTTTDDFKERWNQIFENINKK